MKSIRRVPGLSFILAGSIALLSLLHPQKAAAQSESGQPESIVQLTAESQGLSLVSPGDQPPIGTFWVVATNGIIGPWPCPPICFNFTTAFGWERHDKCQFNCML